MTTPNNDSADSQIELAESSTRSCERRANPRRSLHALATLRPMRGLSWRRGATVRNIARRGLMIELTEGVIARDLEICIEMPAQNGRARIAAIAIVRWCAGRHVGLEILAMLPHHRERFEELTRVVDGGSDAREGVLSERIP
jgi:hypothetical protein